MTADTNPPSGPPPVPEWSPPTAPMAPTPAQPPIAPKRRGIRKRWIVLGAVVGLGGFGLYQIWQQEQNYQAGHAAYVAADCASAVGPLGRAAAGDPGSADSDVAIKATAELQECEALLAADALVTQGKPADGVLAFSDFVTKYPQSPLVDAALGKGQDAIASDPDEVATTDVCDGLDMLEAQRFVASPADTLPPLLFACGQAYEEAAMFAEALAAYARFRADYPDHALADEVDAALVRATLAETDASGAGSLPPPQEVGKGTGEAGVATVVIQNDLPDQLSMVFSGPDVRVEDLAACTECRTYIGVGPAACPELGPTGNYVVKPGTYEVVVKSGSGGDVTPFRGTWTLVDGQEYASCFFIVRQ